MPQELKAVPVGDERGLLELEEAWTRILAGCPHRTIFMTHDWARLWWRHRGAGRDLWVLVVREADRIVGIAPFVLGRERWKGLPVRKLGFIQEMAGGTASHADILLEDEPLPVLGAIVRHLEERARDWDVIVLRGIPAESPTTGALRRMLRESRLRTSDVPLTQLTNHLALDSDWGTYLAGKSSNFRKNLKVSEARLRKRGALRCVRATSPAEIPSAYARLCEVESRSRKGRASPGEAALWEDLVRTLAPRGGCDIRLLEVDGTAVAATLCLLHDRRMYGIKTCYDMEFAHASPGRVLFHELVRDAFSLGIAEIDFMGLWPYLAQWGPGVKRCEGLFIHNTRLYSRLLGGAKGLASRLRRRSREAP